MIETDGHFGGLARADAACHSNSRRVDATVDDNG